MNCFQGHLMEPGEKFCGSCGSPPQMSTPPPTQHSVVPPRAAGSSNVILKVILALLAVGFVVTAVVVVGVMMYFNKFVKEVEVASNTGRQPRLTLSPTPGSSFNETEELRKQIAELEKRLNEQTTTNRPADIPLSLPGQSTDTRSAQVNSPSDGFLALRTTPSAQLGSRILEIPHGATVTVGGCLATTRVGSRSGRWCRSSYNGYSGWVFDGFLVY